MTAASSIRLLVVAGSPPVTEVSCPSMTTMAANPPGPGFPEHAPSVFMTMDCGFLGMLRTVPSSRLTGAIY